MGQITFNGISGS